MPYTGSTAQRRFLERVFYRCDEAGADFEAAQNIVEDVAQLWADAESSAQSVLRRAPVSLVTRIAKPGAGAAVKVLAADHMRVVLPLDFVRLLRLRCTAWLRPLTAFTTPDDPAYQMAKLNAFGGPDVARPLAALVPYAGAPGALELYPRPASVADLAELSYVPVTAPDALPSGGVLYEACAFEAASRLAQTLRYGDVAQGLERRAAQVLQDAVEAGAL
jgi:hypothetical protein